MDHLHYLVQAAPVSYKCQLDRHWHPTQPELELCVMLDLMDPKVYVYLTLFHNNTCVTMFMSCGSAFFLWLDFLFVLSCLLSLRHVCKFAQSFVIPFYKTGFISKYYIFT
jgi:hypothetical protein